MNKNKFASLCLLAYERPDYLIRCLTSLKRSTHSPHEIIVNDDGSKNMRVSSYLTEMAMSGNLSWLIMNLGLNMGVGKAFRNCIGISEGDYIYKLDTDLEFLDNWLSVTNDIIEKHEDVGCCGLFNYRNYDKQDTRFNILEERDNCYIVDDFVNSGYGFRREIYNLYGYNITDDGFQQFVKSQGYLLAIPKKDVALNFGFGEGKSVYVQNGKAVDFNELPKIFQ